MGAGGESEERALRRSRSSGGRCGRAETAAYLESRRRIETVSLRLRLAVAAALAQFRESQKKPSALGKATQSPRGTSLKSPP